MCKSSDYYRDIVSTTYGNSINDFKIVDFESLDSPTDQGITADPRNRELVYSNFSYRSPDVKYWSLPSCFLGDKITAYGDNLKYTLRYKPTQGGSSSKNTALDVELISKNHIRLSHNRRFQTEPNIAQTISVPLLEQDWQRNDGQISNREHLLMALADIQSIIIKATYTKNSQEVALSSVALDIAENRFMGNPARALEVEQYDCPPVYVGLSCLDCNYDFKRALHGLYLGLCEKCEYNGFPEECDAETGYCFICRAFRTGSYEYCDQCAQGYVKNDLNQCVRSEEGGDPRGSIATTCYGGYCRCKINVVGQTCNRCREGTFGLSENLTEGCQSCFCSGVLQ